jgi:hypothetical protein
LSELKAYYAGRFFRNAKAYKVDEVDALLAEKGAEIERLRGRLKTTAVFLKPIANRVGSAPICWQCNGIIIEARKALTGIKEESEQNNFQKKLADEHRWGPEEPDWKDIERDAKDEDSALGAACYSYQGKALLYLRDKLSKLEDTIEDTQAEIIRRNNDKI